MKYKISALLSLKGRAERYIGTPSKGVRLFLYCVAHPNGGGAFSLLLTPLVIYKGAVSGREEQAKIKNKHNYFIYYKI
jgi:hypothetical protein